MVTSITEFNINYPAIRECNSNNISFYQSLHQTMLISVTEFNIKKWLPLTQNWQNWTQTIQLSENVIQTIFPSILAYIKQCLLLSQNQQNLQQGVS